MTKNDGDSLERYLVIGILSPFFICYPVYLIKVAR